MATKSKTHGTPNSVSAPSKPTAPKADKADLEIGAPRGTPNSVSASAPSGTPVHSVSASAGTHSVSAPVNPRVQSEGLGKGLPVPVIPAAPKAAAKADLEIGAPGTPNSGSASAKPKSKFDPGAGAKVIFTPPSALARTFKIQNELGRARRLERLARSNPDVAWVLNGTCPHCGKSRRPGAPISKSAAA
jgi:hypothetical protein